MFTKVKMATLSFLAVLVKLSGMLYIYIHIFVVVARTIIQSHQETDWKGRCLHAVKVMLVVYPVITMLM